MIKKIPFILFIAFCISTQAQNNGATIQVFKPNQSLPVLTKAHKDSVRKTDKNCLKWNWAVLTRGVFLINYEIYLGGKFSLEIGAGVTYRDFLFEYTKSIGGDTIQQFSSNTNTSGFGSASPRMCGEAGLKYYPSGFDNMEGAYLEVTVSYRSYAFPTPSYTPIIDPTSTTPGYNFIDTQFKFGYSASHWFSDFVTEFYIGIGVRNATINTFQDETVYTNSYYYNPTVTEAYKPITLHSTFPQPLFGFKLGYPF